MENIKVYIRFKPREPKTESLLSYDTITISDSKTKEIFSIKK